MISLYVAHEPLKLGHVWVRIKESDLLLIVNIFANLKSHVLSGSLPGTVVQLWSVEEPTGTYWRLSGTGMTSGGAHWYILGGCVEQ